MAKPSPVHRHYDTSRTYYREAEDFPGPRTMEATVRWLEDRADMDERFMLFVDEFDPHEPFDTPQPWATMYDDTWAGPRLIWPPYIRDALRLGHLTPRQAFQLRSNYGSKLTMIDWWFGRVLDAIDRKNLWHNTAVIVCTDHGHYLGEHDIWGKPAVPIYQELGHLPLFVAWPGVAPRDVAALTTSVDLFATIADVFGVDPPHHTHGRSLTPLIHATAGEVRQHLIMGVWGREVHVVGDGVKYAAAPAGPNFPLSMWSNRWSTMPLPEFAANLPRPDARAELGFMPRSSVPVIRQPFEPGDLLPFWAKGPFDGNHLYLLDQDPAEEENHAGTRHERQARDLLRTALEEVDAPAEQLARLGLA